ncbi:MAG TPA: 6-phosphofructokinase, partial [Chloroflexota bacterium]|nr:6-phosphofructokinase [Chloroflexota bacterium]
VFQEDATEDKLARLGGISSHLATQLARRIPQDVRFTVLGHLQRGGSPTPFDRILGTRFGGAAVRLVAEGGLDKMVALHTPDIVPVELSEAIGSLKRVKPDGELVRTARDMGIFMGDE